MAFGHAQPHAQPHHDPRHIVEDGPIEGLVSEVIHEDDTETTEGQDEDLKANVRHHVYMPLPLAYRQSAQPPIIKYLPVYSNADSR